MSKQNLASPLPVPPGTEKKQTEVNLDSLFKQSLVVHQRGQLAEAQAGYEQILKQQPGHFDALHLLGVIAFQRRDLEGCVTRIRQAIAINPNVPSTHNNIGNALKDLKRYDEALASYERAIALKPDYAEAYSNRGNALQDLRRFDEALANYEHAIEFKPGLPEAHSNRGNVLRDLQRFDEALASYDRAIALKQDYAEAYYKRGNVLQDLRRFDEAIASYDRAIALKQDHAEAHSNRGNALKNLRRFEEALASYDRAIALKPDYAEAYSNRGVVLGDLKRFDEALASYDRAIALRPDYAGAYSNRGNVLRDLRRFDEAFASYDRAIALRPDYAEAYSNRGNALRDVRRFEDAIVSYDRAIALKPDYLEAYSNRGIAQRDIKRFEDALASYGHAIALRPDYADAHWNESLIRLLLGDFELGWKKYEWRWEWEHMASFKRNFTQPLWLGADDIRGKTLLLHAEQGLGDTIQFCRYVRMVHELGAKVVLEVPSLLLSLLTGLEGVDVLISRGQSLPAFDYHCPLLSLPLAFATRMDTIPAKVPYLLGDPQKMREWEHKLGEKRTLRVGLVWSGSTMHNNDRNRSLPLSQILRGIPPEVSLYSLQKEVRESDRATVESRKDIVDFSEELRDFSDTAALICLMDVVVCVDTAVAHLAGALGKRVWVLLPFVPDWRWLLDRDDSPWYPTMRLFRQLRLDDWGDVLVKVKNELIQIT